ncbi:MAG: hypothetical protein ABGX83_01310 [Nitrospira sp.]|nr:hypothetical protein [Candidatus Manganitrophaceae bacterium]HIL35564.1 hypothetical protein [Candidatus Manganitrophaceae bacterium]
MKQIRIVVGALFFVSLIVGAIPAEAKTDPETGLKVTKPYAFSEPGDAVFISTGFPTNPTIVDSDKMKIRARLTFTPNEAYHLSVTVRDVDTRMALQTLFVFFNDGSMSSGTTSAKGKIHLTAEDPLLMVDGDLSSGKSDIKIISSGLPKGTDLTIKVTLIPRNPNLSSITQMGFVRTSSK